jgi:hypothetical protein
MPLDYTLPFAISLLVSAGAAVALAVLLLARLSFWLLRRPFGARRALPGAAGLLALGALGVWVTLRTKGARLEHAAMDLAMTQAPRPPRGWREAVVAPAPYRILAGDLHCHVSPPDDPGHVARGLAETLRLARQEDLDFVSLVPHMYSNFQRDAGWRAQVAALVEGLQAQVDARTPDGLLLDVGLEHVDPDGHFNMVFGDVPGALRATAAQAAAGHPEAFVKTFADRGGLLIINHPLLTPLPSRAPLAWVDISWRPFTGRPAQRPVLDVVDARADGVEVANLFVSAVRDRFLRGDPEASTREVLSRLDREIVARGRRMTPTAGTDSHSFHLRPVLFVLAEERSRAGVRAAIRAGRTCVVQPAACTFEARVEGSAAFSQVGASLAPATRVEVRAQGQAVAVYRNGERVAAPARGEVALVEVPAGACSVLRATVDGGYSAPVYVNCPFAEGR